MQAYLVFIIIFFSFAFGAFAVFMLDFLLYFFKNRKVDTLIEKAKTQAELIINQGKADLKIRERQNDLKMKEEHFLKNKSLQDKIVAIDQKQQQLQEEESKINKRKEKLQENEEANLFATDQLKKQRQQILSKLQVVSGLSQKEAMKELLANLEKLQTQRLNKLTKDRIDAVEQNVQSKINNILANAMDRYAKDYVVDSTLYKIDLDSNEVKGKIIGKQGRNIKSFEELSGVDLLIDPEKPMIRLSCFNPVRRTIAFNALKKLIQDGRIQPERIKETLATEKVNLDLFAKQEGQAVADQFKITNLHPKLIHYLGLLKFRTSYGQNVLQHSIETANLAGAIAVELNLDHEKAIRAGLLHDIGKAKDHQEGLSHVVLGVKIAKECDEDEFIINAIHAHHEDVAKTNVYSVLVSIADTLSAARPGAREHTQKDFFERMKKIEKICKEVEGVKDSYAVKSGRVIRIIVDANKVNDFEVEKIAENVQSKIKTELRIPGDVKVEVVRELKVSKNV